MSDVIEVQSDNTTTIIEQVIEVVSVVEQGPPGPPGPPGSGAGVVYDNRIEEISPEVVYRADAAVGSSDTASVWRIRRITVTYGGTLSVATAYPNGDSDFKFQWSERHSYTYS